MAARRPHMARPNYFRSLQELFTPGKTFQIKLENIFSGLKVKFQGYIKINRKKNNAKSKQSWYPLSVYFTRLQFDF